MKFCHPQPVAIAICIYCGLQALGLVYAWKNSPYDRMGGVAFGIWCIPIFWYWLKQAGMEASPQTGKPLFLGLGLFLSYNGSMGSMHILEHLGLVFALGGIMPTKPIVFLWMAAAITWMPVFGWLSGRLFAAYSDVVRFSILFFPVSGLFYFLSRSNKRTQ